MRRTFLSWLFFTTLAGSSFGQDPGCWHQPYITQPTSQTVCYICKLTYKPSFVSLGFPFYEQEQTVAFEVVNLCEDPFIPRVIEVKVEGGKYPYGFLKVGNTYSLVAEKRHVQVPVLPCQRDFGCSFMPFPRFEDKYLPISIVSCE
jgi:hypothetical protein